MNKRVCMSFGCLCILLAGFFSGCLTTPHTLDTKVEIVKEQTTLQSPLPLQPMTAALVHALGTGAVSGYQYYLSSPVILARERQELTGRNNQGALHLDNIYTRETITFDGNTKGKVIAVETNAVGKLTLIACFGPDTTLSLRFVQTGDDGYFDLETIRDEIVQYGSEEYHVLSNEKLIRTRLLISMDGKNTIKDEQHIAPGRNAGDKRNEPPTQLDKSEIDLTKKSDISEAAPDDNLSIAKSPPPTSENFPIVPTVYIGNSIDLPPPVLPESLSKATPLSAAPVLPESPPQAAPLPATPVLPESLSKAAPLPATPALPKSLPKAPHRIQVQVGAYKNADNARQTIERLNAVGFNSDYVRQGEHYRVIIAGGVPAEDIADVKSRLSSAGFDKLWIWAEY